MTFIIAEIGINHNGSLDLAKKLIDLAIQSGCDAVKFQKRTVDVVYSQEFLDSPRESPWGSTQRAQKEALEFSIDDYQCIDDYCKTKGIEWFASCWDIPSQKLMRHFSSKYNKVASAMATHLEFLKVVAEEKKHTFLSTGMMNLEMIDEAVQIFKDFECPFTLLHTVSTYPCSEEDLNLKCILTLRERYGVDVGYSGHEVSVTPSLIAVLLGATAIERHITLDRASYGSDQSASLEPPGLRQLVSQIRKVPVCLGDGVKKFSSGEATIEKKLRYWVQP